MQFIHSVLTFNEILTVSLLSWFVAQVRAAMAWSMDRSLT